MAKKSRLRSKAYAFAAATALTISGLLPMMLGSAKAAQVTLRSLTLESSQPGAVGQNIWHEFQFNAATTGNVGSLEFTYCTTPLGSCTAPTGLDFTTNGFSLGTSLTDQSLEGGAWTSNYAVDSAGQTANRIRINTGTANSVTAPNDTLKFRFDNIENPTTTAFGPTSGNNSFFVRIATYSDTGYATAVDSGAVASAIVPLLTVSARVQEILHFCVDNTTINDDTTSIGADCANLAGAVTGNNVDLGVVDSSTTGAVSPDSDGNSANGVFMIRTNAVGGSLVGYRAVQQTGTNHQGALRVVGASCNAGTVNTDQCFNAQTSKTALVASTEQFGMTGRYINRTSSATPTANLSLAAAYDSTSTVGYAWQEDGSFVTVADSSGSTDKVIDDESVILSFAAVSALTTPTGQYQAQADFVAVPTY